MIRMIQSSKLLASQQFKYRMILSQRIAQKTYVTNQSGKQQDQKSDTSYSGVDEMTGSCTDRDSMGSQAGYGSNSMEGSNTGLGTQSELHHKEKEIAEKMRKSDQKSSKR